MPTRVQLPDGNVGEFPDGMSNDDITAVLQKQYGGMATPQNAPPVPKAPVPQGLQPDQPQGSLLDRLKSAVSNIDAPSKPTDSAFETGAHAFVRSASAPILHPLNTLGGIAKTAAFNMPGGNFTSPDNPLVQTGQSIANSPHPVAEAVGDIAGGYAGGKALSVPFQAARMGAGALGIGLQDASEANLNRIYPPSTKETLRGENPGRGILQSGIGPTLTKGSMAVKLENASNAVGSRIGNTVGRADLNANAPQITPSRVAPAIESPINSAVARIKGPGGTAPTEPYQDLGISMTRTAPGASGPIYGQNASDIIPPSDLWRTIRNIDENTKFHTDPEVESVNETRRDIRGGLRSVLESTDPSIEGLSRTYSDLQSARTAVPRSSSPVLRPRGILGQLTDATLNSTGLNSTASSLGYRAGGVLRRLSGEAQGSTFPGFGLKTGSTKPLQLEANVPGNADYGEDFSNGTIGSRSSVTTPPPANPFLLPSSTTAGEPQPMIAVKAPTPYPGLATDFAKTRIAPTQFNGPPTNPFSLPKGLLPEPKVTAKQLFKKRSSQGD